MSDSPRPRILVVEDDAKLAELVREFLVGNGYDVSIEGRGDRAVSRILGERPRLVVLDLMLPGLDGLSVCRQVRPSFDGAILMLTARGEEIDEVVGLEVGADDYLAKPVRPRLLLARVSSLLRRLGTEGGERVSARGDDGRRVVVGNLEVDPASRAVHLDGREIALTTAEFDLLHLLAQNAGRVISRDQIYRELMGSEYDGLDRSIDLRVARLRRKLGDDGKSPRRIKSVRGAGYLMAQEP